MWELEAHDDITKRHKRFVKKWPRELTNVLDNLDTLFQAFAEGMQPEQAKNLRFVRSEPKGILAVDEKGPRNGGRRLKPFRLYTFPDVDNETLYVRTLGDKSTQKKDIAVTVEFVEGILEARKIQREKPTKDSNGEE